MMIISGVLYLLMGRLLEIKKIVNAQQLYIIEFFSFIDYPFCKSTFGKNIVVFVLYLREYFRCG